MVHLHRRRWLTTLAAAALAAAAGGCPEPSTSTPMVTPRDAGSPAGSAASPTTAPAGTGAGTSAGTAAGVGLSEPVARIRTVTITRGELDDALYRAYGINLLADVVELDLAKAELAKAGMHLDAADVAAERQRSLAKMFDKDTPDQYDGDFRQLQQQEHRTAEEFDLAFGTTAALRKLTRPQLAGQVTDAVLHQEFGLMYGEKRQIEDITVENLAQAGEAHQRLAAGVPFEAVARQLSKDPLTAPSGGAWPPFGIKNPSVPQAIMESAFALKPGQVSPDVLADGTRFHIIKLVGVIEPKVVQFDAVKDLVRADVEDQLEQSAVKQLRAQLRKVFLTQIQLDDPSLKAAMDALIAAQQPKGATVPAGKASDRIGAAERPRAMGPTTTPAAAAVP